MNYLMELKKIEDYVSAFYAERNEEKYPFHSLSNTRDLAGIAGKIAGHHDLDDHSWFIVCAAAWFRNAGYVAAAGQVPEQKSIDLADEYFRGIGLPTEDITAVNQCIIAAGQRKEPETLPEKILCDADCFYFGTDDFKEKRKQLRKELEATGNVKIEDGEWISSGIAMLEKHRYYTEYCRSLLDEPKARRIEKLKVRQQKQLAGEQVNETTPGAESIARSKKDKLPKELQPVKGIEMMFRVSSGNNVRISVMADNKAHILITVNSIIISVVLGLIIRNIEDNRNLVIPSLILVTVNVLTIIYSVLATMPKINKGVFTEEQVKKKSINILYFGSFFKMDFPEYKSAINAVMHDSEFMYSCLTKDLYWQGKVLGRKYRLLRYAYIIFLYGIITAVLAFLIAVLVSD